MNEINPNDQDPDQLRIENEIRKMKLQLQFGAGFHNPDPHSTLPPNIEKIFLDQVEEFERAHAASKPIKLYDYIGNPQFRKASSMNDSEIDRELSRIHEILFENYIACDSIYEVENRIIYTFITEELFNQEIEDMRIPGLVLHFCYEEFYPNHENDIEDKVIDFFDKLLFANETVNFDEVHEIRNKIELMNFRDSFVRFDLIELVKDSISITEKIAEAVFKIDLACGLEGSAIKEKFSGYARIELIREEWFWEITKVLLPGMKNY